MKARDVSMRLAERAESVAAYLLPGGVREGNCWRTGSVDGDKGRSLKVVLTGERAGRWCDHASDTDHGDLLDLWCATRHTGLREAIEEAKEWLGIREPVKIKPAAPARIKAPEPAKGVHRLNQKGAVFEYLTEQRKITPDVLDRFCVAEMIHAKHGSVIVFPSMKNQKRVMIKYLPLARENGKAPWTSKDSAKILFGWQALPDTRQVVLTEGEIDAMTLATVGIPALSIPYGAGKQSQQEWIENDYPDLEHFDEIIVWMDDDEAGHSTAKEIVNRLGIERCRIAVASHGCNDPNEMLQKGCKPNHFQDCLDQARAITPDRLKGAAEYRAELHDTFYPPGGIEPGFDMGWRSMEWLRFRPAELVVVSGFNGHGKSQVAGQIVLQAMSQGHKACIASLEMPVKNVLNRLARQAGCTDEPSHEYIDAITDWFIGKLWLYDHTGHTDVDDMLDAFTYARKRYGVTVFLIDSLMMLSIASDDYSGQKDFVQRIMEWEKDNETTVFLVAHSRKQSSEEHQPSKLDVRGAGEITDMADTVLTMWRNKREDREIDGKLICSKQRNGEREGDHAVWYDAPSMQFKPGSRLTPWRFVPFSNFSKAGERA